MVKTKHQRQKSKPNARQTHTRKQGKVVDISEFRAQLDALGLKIIQVTADGNCFFRALADQLDGDEDEHQKYRTMVVEFITKNREMFEPFIEDEVPFDEYCESMEKDGTWAGHMELQAASLVTHCNICIHRHMSPRWYIKNFDKREVRMIHLSYHDGEHYNSVRSKDDTCAGPARPIEIKADADLSTMSPKPKAAATRSRDAGRDIVQPGSVKMAMAGSGCGDTGKVEQVLRQVGGDVDAAIEFLIADGSCTEKSSYDDLQEDNSKRQVPKLEDETCKQDSSGGIAEKNKKEKSSQHEEKKIPRNKDCPCGSKKKYKSCCGSVAGKSSARFSVNQTVDYGKSRKDRKQGKKGGSTNSVNSKKVDGYPPDVGALCI